MAPLPARPCCGPAPRQALRPWRLLRLHRPRKDLARPPLAAQPQAAQRWRRQQQQLELDRAHPAARRRRRPLACCAAPPDRPHRPAAAEAAAALPPVLASAEAEEELQEVLGLAPPANGRRPAGSPLFGALADIEAAPPRPPPAAGAPIEPDLELPAPPGGAPIYVFGCVHAGGWWAGGWMGGHPALLRSQACRALRRRCWRGQDSVWGASPAAPL